MSTPPPSLDDLDLDQLKARVSEKWNTYPDDVLPAWVAEMDYPLAEPIRFVLQRAADLGDVGYPIALHATGLPELFGERMRGLFGWELDPARVEIITDVVQGLYVGLDAYAVEREGVVVQTPIYPPFLQAVEDTGRRLVDNAMVRSEGRRMEFDLDGLREQVDDNTGILLLCNPHNPSGRVYTRAELETLAEIVVSKDLVVIADEIHADLVYSGHHHIPFASLGPEIQARTVTLASASKSFNIPGLRCAVVHFGTETLQQRYRSAHPRHVRGGIGLLGIQATLAAWRQGTPWLDSVRSYLEANRAHVEHLLAEQLPEIGFYTPEATYMAWLDCRPLALRASPAAHFLRHGRVALSDGHIFGAAHRGFARINFATSRKILEDVVERMSSAIER